MQSIPKLGMAVIAFVTAIGVTTLARAIDPITAIITTRLAFQTANEGFAAVTSAAQAISSVSQATRDVVGVVGAIRSAQDYNSVVRRMDDFQTSLAQSTEQILTAIDEQPQRMLFNEARALQRSIQLRATDISNSSGAERQEAEAQLRQLAGELERVSFRAQEMLQTSNRVGVHYVGAVHALAIGAGQLRAVSPVQMQQAPRRSLLAVIDALDGSLLAASGSLTTTYNTERAAYQRQINGAASDARFVTLSSGGSIQPGTRSVCFERAQTVRITGNQQPQGQCSRIMVGPGGFNYVECTRYVRTTYRYTITSRQHGQLTMVGALRPADAAAQVTTAVTANSVCGRTNNAEEAWISMANAYNDIAAAATPVGGRAVILDGASNLARQTRAYLTSLRRTV